LEVLAVYWCEQSLSEEARIVVIACDKIEITDTDSGCVGLVVLDCNDWWRDWAGKVIEVYSCSDNGLPRNNHLVEAIYTISIADAVVVWNCDSAILGTMLGFLGKKWS